MVRVGGPPPTVRVGVAVRRGGGDASGEGGALNAAAVEGGVGAVRGREGVEGESEAGVWDGGQRR